MTVTYILTHLNTHEKCINYLEKKRWNNKPICPYCGSNKNNPKKLRHTCLTCKNSFSVTVGTVMENSNLPIYKWLIAIQLMLSAKKGISSMQLSRDLSVNKNTAWLLQMKIRAAMKDGKLELFKPRKFHENSGQNSTASPRDALNTIYGGHFISLNAFGYWSMLKRAIIGQYHKIDEYYLARYVDEIDFKSNRKNVKDKGFEELIRQLLCISSSE